jgi:hypothetical protein
MVIGVVLTALAALVTTPAVVCSSTALSIGLRLLADATGELSKEDSAASSSSMDTSSSSVLVPAIKPSPPGETLEAVLSLAELISAATASAPETVSAASISTSSLSILSVAAPDGSLLSVEDDELSKLSYIKKKKA